MSGILRGFANSKLKEVTTYSWFKLVKQKVVSNEWDEFKLNEAPWVRTLRTQIQKKKSDCVKKQQPIMTPTGNQHLTLLAIGQNPHYSTISQTFV